MLANQESLTVSLTTEREKKRLLPILEGMMLEALQPRRANEMLEAVKAARAGLAEESDTKNQFPLTKVEAKALKSVLLGTGTEYEGLLIGHARENHLSPKDVDQAYMCDESRVAYANKLTTALGEIGVRDTEKLTRSQQIVRDMQASTARHAREAEVLGIGI